MDNKKTAKLNQQIKAKYHDQMVFDMKRGFLQFITVFNQLFYRRRWPFDHFTCRNTIDCSIVKLTNHRMILAYVGARLGHAARLSIGTRDSTMRETTQQKGPAKFPLAGPDAV